MEMGLDLTDLVTRMHSDGMDSLPSISNWHDSLPKTPNHHDESEDPAIQAAMRVVSKYAQGPSTNEVTLASLQGLPDIDILGDTSDHRLDTTTTTMDLDFLHDDLSVGHDRHSDRRSSSRSLADFDPLDSGEDDLLHEYDVGVGVVEPDVMDHLLVDPGDPILHSGEYGPFLRNPRSHVPSSHQFL